MSHQIVHCTCPDQTTAVQIAEALVSEQLAACVHILPGIQSIYRWKGQLEHDEEVLVLIKSRTDKFDELEQAIRHLHPYELPEIVAVSIEAGLPDYLKWINESLDTSHEVV